MDNARLFRSDENKHLDELLIVSGSLWKVGDRAGRAGLERRVTEGVQAAAESAMAVPGSGALLAEAWASSFGRDPDPMKAYSAAIKAVEFAAAPVASPNDTQTTLGKILRQMRDQTKDDTGWRLPLDGRSSDVAIAMIEALWTGQPDRHGSASYRAATQEEGEAAVLLAVPLVHWFTTGALTRR